MSYVEIIVVRLQFAATDDLVVSRAYRYISGYRWKKVQVGKDQEKAQSENDPHSKNRDGKKTKLTIRYSYRKPNEQLFSQ